MTHDSIQDPDSKNKKPLSPKAKKAMDRVATQYAELLWELYWHKRRNGELPDPRKHHKSN